MEKMCAKFTWSCFNSHNLIVRNISMAAKISSFSDFGDNYRYLSYKYGIGIHVWHLPLCRQLPKINHEFPKQSLRYKLNVLLNETDSNLISKAETISLYQFKQLIKSNMINNYKDTCEESNCFVCNL